MPFEIRIGQNSSAQIAQNEPVIATSDKQGNLSLPSIILVPKTLADVLVHTIEVKVSGNLGGVKLLAAAYGGQESFFAVFDPPCLLPSSGIPTTPLTLSLAEQEVPPGTYKLSVRVTYEWKPFEGAPSPKVEMPYEATLIIPPDLPRPTRLTWSWKRREAIVDREPGAELEIYADRLPSHGFLEVCVEDPRHTWLSTYLRYNPPTRVGEPDASGRIMFLQTIKIERLDAAIRDDIRLQAPLPVDLIIRARVESIPASENKPAVFEELGSVTIKGKDKNLLIDFVDNVFDGFPILDIGTSSMFAVIYSSQQPIGFLHSEHEQTYRSVLMNYFSRTDGLFGSSVWNKLLSGVVRNVVRANTYSDSPAKALFEYLRQTRPGEGGTDSAIHRVVRALEMQIFSAHNVAIDARLEINRLLADLHRQAFSKFPLDSQRLREVNLDLNARRRGVTLQGDAADVRAKTKLENRITGVVEPIPSTTEVTSTGGGALAGVGHMSVDIGHQAQNNRREAIKLHPESLSTRFHSSPKPYYSGLGRSWEKIKISAGGEVEEVLPSQFLTASLIHLRERIDKFRHDEGMSEKRFNKIVLTFPTSAPLNVRMELVKVAQAAGFDQPVSNLDEALSAIVFHLVRPFGGDEELGLEAYRTTCRPVFRADADLPREWRQNLLLIDIGGGTTDIALVEVRLTDETPAGQDTALGRYYRLTPTLLGATGRGQLAGNLLTLGLYHLLKARIADAILTHFGNFKLSESEDQEFATRIRNAFAKLQPPFGTNENYQAGSILQHYDIQQLWKSQADNVHASYAFELVNDVLPTIWQDKQGTELKNASCRFQDLWDLAEELKVTTFYRGESEYRLDPVRLSELLGTSQDLAPQLPAITLSYLDFLSAVEPPLNDIAKLAVSLVASRLGTDPPSLASTQEVKHGTLDRIILTGRSCKLPLVRKKIVDEFRVASSDPRSELRWDSARIDFEDDYAKKAAAIGASYARVLYQSRVAPTRIGTFSGNQLDVDIENLMFYLQCGFKLRKPSSPLQLIEFGKQFQYFDESGVGYVVSPMSIKPSETINIDRYDFSDDGGQPWGEVDCKRFSEEARIPWFEFQREIHAGIEANQRLEVKMLFCRGAKLHFALPPAENSEWNLARKLMEFKVIPSPATPTSSESQPSKNVNGPTPSPLRAIPADWLDSANNWIVVINEKSQYSKILFTLTPGMFATDTCDTIFRKEDLSVVRGVVGDDLPPPPDLGVDEYSIRPADGSKGSINIGSMNRPKSKTVRPERVRIVLTEHGDFLIQMGELMHKTSNSPEDLKHPGIVVKLALSYPKEKPSELTDPFNGRH